ncbi:MAG: YeeE/YedE family protein [Pseudomonadota bacterium]
MTVSLGATLRAPLPPMQRPVAAIAGGLAIVAAMLAFALGGQRAGAGAVIGVFAGLALYHAAFGFTGGWRRMVAERRGRGLRLQVALIASVSLVSLPLLVFDEALGLRVGGFVFPFGIGAAVGATLFGIGMQLGGGCGSGTLFTVGGGSTRMVITLAAFVAGSLLGTAHLPAWNALPRLSALSLPNTFGLPAAMAFTMAGLGAIALVSWVIERRAHDHALPTPEPGGWLRGPWGPWMGVAALTLVCLACFVFVGRPWGITSGFALWGAKIASAIGVPVETWPYWRGQVGAIERPPLADTTSAMNVGIILGALLAAGLAGRFAPKRSLTGWEIATAVSGGLLMGYGARLSYGCNIGAYLGGITSGSLHGWLWFVFAFAGSTATVLFRQRLARA